ncbi:MAG: DUF1307 domain-containing protein [Lachnospiraceae bacterium]|nr:DUF1307 domain-containing protein [Lachnospiraceae bacterium]
MKKLMNLLLSLTLVLALAGCGKEQSATYVLNFSQDGVSMVDTQVYQATGDIVTQMDENVVIDLSALDDTTKELMVAYYDEFYGAMGTDVPEGVTFSSSYENDIYTVNLSMNLKEADLQVLGERGYLLLTSENGETVKVISFKQTCEYCEANGYVLQQ